MGSIARVNIIYTNLIQFIDTLPEGFPIYGTLLDGENIYTQTLTPHGLIIMGNEGNGISAEIRQRINHRLLIPSYRQATLPRASMWPSPPPSPALSSVAAQGA